MEEQNQSVPGLFDFLNALSYTKEDLLTNDKAISAYSQWVTDVAFSQHLDTIHFANLANTLRLSKRNHYDFYIGLLPKKKRFGKWAKKPPVDESLEQLAVEVLKWPKRRAADISKVLDIAQVQNLLTRLEKGGKV